MLLLNTLRQTNHELYQALSIRNYTCAQLSHPGQRCNIVEFGNISVVTAVDFKDLRGVFYGEIYTTESIGTNESPLF
jgi:hypothetical protein